MAVYGAAMITYSLLAVPFLFIALLLFLRSKQKFHRQWVITAVILFVLTAIFDSLIIYAKIVDYDYTKLLGIRIGRAPIEDFAYTVAAVLLIPALWRYTAPKKEKS